MENIRRALAAIAMIVCSVAAAASDSEWRWMVIEPNFEGRGDPPWIVHQGLTSVNFERGGRFNAQIIVKDDDHHQVTLALRGIDSGGRVAALLLRMNTDASDEIYKGVRYNARIGNAQGPCMNIQSGRSVILICKSLANKF